jgi:hypothetical protein
MSESEAQVELGGTGFDSSDQWSDDQVLEALGSAGRSEFGNEPEQAPAPTPEGATDAAPEEEGQAPPEVAPQVEQPETFDGGKFNPDDLPPELQDGWKQLQAAFTQKTQELAAERQQFEALGDPEAIQQAVDLYNRIGDPTNWQQLHAELTQAMQGMGMTPFEAQQAATEAMTQQPAAPEGDTAQFEDMDPEVASLAQQLAETRQELDSFRQGFQEQLMNQEAERQYIQALTEIQKQEAAIREAHPQWGDDKIQAAYEFSSFYNGNLAQGAARLEQVLAQERELYLSQKSGAMDDSTRTPATTFVADATKVSEPTTLAEAEAEAEEWFKARVAELDQ